MDTICEVVKEAAQKWALPVIDIHALTGENPQWFSADSVHPDNDGAEAIAQKIYSMLANSES